MAYRTKRGDQKVLRGAGVFWSHLETKGRPGGVESSWQRMVAPRTKDCRPGGVERAPGEGMKVSGRT